MTKLKIGLIGYGYWGKNLARNFNNLSVLKCIYDTNEIALKAAKKNYPKLDLYDDIEGFFKENISAVVISSPAKTHAELVKYALNHDKHVFVEKPLCLDYEEGLKLKKLANKKKLKLMVGHLLLYHPAFLALKKIINDRKIGKIRYMYSNRLSLGKLRKEENALWSFAPHDISMILSLIGSEPIKVRAVGGAYLSPNIADTTMTLLKFNNGVKAHVFVSWLHPYKDQKLIVVGDEGMITFDDVQKNEHKLIFYKHKATWDDEIPLINKAEGVPIKYDQDVEPLKLECMSFLSWLERDEVPSSDVDEGLRVLKVLNKAEMSLLEEGF